MYDHVVLTTATLCTPEKGRFSNISVILESDHIITLKVYIVNLENYSLITLKDRHSKLII